MQAANSINILSKKNRLQSFNWEFENSAHEEERVAWDVTESVAYSKHSRVKRIGTIREWFRSQRTRTGLADHQSYQTTRTEVGNQKPDWMQRREGMVKRMWKGMTGQDEGGDGGRSETRRASYVTEIDRTRVAHTGKNEGAKVRR